MPPTAQPSGLEEENNPNPAGLHMLTDGFCYRLHQSPLPSSLLPLGGSHTCPLFPPEELCAVYQSAFALDWHVSKAFKV